MILYVVIDQSNQSQLKRIDIKKITKTTNTNKGTFTMKQLILKGLGKAKVKRIVKAYVLYEFNEFISDIMTYGDNDQVFQLHIGAIVQGFGLPEICQETKIQ